MSKQVDTFTLANGSVIDVWENAVFSHIPGEAEACPAQPQGEDSIIDCLAHEVSHHLAAQCLRGEDAKPVCLQNGGKHHKWNQERLAEEQLALRLGPQIADAMRAAQRLPLDRKRNAWRKLSREQVKALRADYEKGVLSLRQLGAKYGVSRTAAYKVAKGFAYKEVRK